MSRTRQGDTSAAGPLVSICYPEIKRMARAQMRGERRNHTWQPTVLVNQLYLELLKIRGLPDGPAGTNDRDAFLGLAAHLMRRMLIHHARPLAKRLEVPEFIAASEPLQHGESQLREVEDILLDLERIDPLFRVITEMKALEGLSMEEIAEQLRIPLRTVYRRWAFARLWLAEYIGIPDPS